jgi:hypothetical protein
MRFRQHARTRQAQRGFTHDHVAQTLRRPDRERPAKGPHAKRFEKAFSKKRRLVVIAEENPSEFLVITAWWLD